MKTVVVTGKAATTAVSMHHDGEMRWDSRVFHDLPKVLGNADPVRYAQMTPGIQTNSDMDAGLHIQGSDQTHNMFSIHEVPIYNAAHMLGIFSVFNASHYTAMTLKKHAQLAKDPARLGGMLNMELSETTADSVSGEVAVGFISSQGTLRLPTGKRSSLTLSGRTSYLNLLYGRWLSEDDMQMKYSFFDANATWTWQPSSRHSVLADFYAGNDRMHMDENEYMARMRLRWGNTMAAVHVLSDLGGRQLRNSVYFTSYRNRLQLSQAEAVFRLPSDINDLGYKGSISCGQFSAGAEATWHNLLPQDPVAEGIYNTQLSRQPRYHTQEYSLHADYHKTAFGMLDIAAGLRGNAYVDFQDKCHLSADPSLGFSLTRSKWNATLSYAVRHQYLFQTGTSSLGMPTEFWTSIGGDIRPQWGHGPSLLANVYVAGGRVRLSAEAYYRRLTHQIEYDGDIMKFLNTDYRLEENLLRGKGENYGFSVMAHKLSGKVTGWVSYAYGRARRHFSEGTVAGTFPANHERPHEINALATWHQSRRWTFSGVFTYASGTPFTAPEHFYVMNGMLLAEYGEHNAHRLRPYYRLDLSANFLFRSRSLEHGLNLSVFNVTGHNNDVTCRLKIYHSRYKYAHYSLLKFPLPSISYFAKF